MCAHEHESSDMITEITWEGESTEPQVDASSATLNEQSDKWGNKAHSYKISYFLRGRVQLLHEDPVIHLCAY